MIGTRRLDLEPEILRQRAARYARVGRMREHLRRQRINALRPDGTFEDKLLVHVCKAFSVLPEEIGVTRPAAETIDTGKGPCMATTTVDLSQSTITVEVAPSEICPGCHGEMTGLEMYFEQDPDGRVRLGLHPAYTSALPCRCRLGAPAPKKPTMHPRATTAEIPMPPADGPRAWHAWYARVAGYFWLPCPVCDREFGGHEWLPPATAESSIPDLDQPSQGYGICPACARAGHGTRAWARVRGEPAVAPDTAAALSTEEPDD